MLEISGLVLVSHAMEELVRHGSRGNNKRKGVKRKGVTLQESKRKELKRKEVTLQ